MPNVHAAIALLVLIVIHIRRAQDRLERKKQTVQQFSRRLRGAIAIVTIVWSPASIANRFALLESPAASRRV
jgi:hypothetical protein